eukprot:gene7926-biopygen6718
MAEPLAIPFRSSPLRAGAEAEWGVGQAGGRSVRVGAVVRTPLREDGAPAARAEEAVVELRLVAGALLGVAAGPPPIVGQAAPHPQRGCRPPRGEGTVSGGGVKRGNMTTVNRNIGIPLLNIIFRDELTNLCCSNSAGDDGRRKQRPPPPPPAAGTPLCAEMAACATIDMVNMIWTRNPTYGSKAPSTQSKARAEASLVAKWQHSGSKTAAQWRQSSGLAAKWRHGDKAAAKRGGNAGGRFAGDMHSPNPAPQEKLSRPQQQEQHVEGEDGAGGVTVTLTRRTFEQFLPWGFVLHPDTLQLGPPLKGSIAGASSRLRSCVGMFLAELDGVDVRCPDDVKFTTDEQNTIQMLFSRTRPAPPPQQTARLGAEGAASAGAVHRSSLLESPPPYFEPAGHREGPRWGYPDRTRVSS